ncbi:DUF4817 domain-containing protein [Trichonephila clavipes]|nr:DUF4817 domain-containing protein [Trichonephila clavipes]
MVGNVFVRRKVTLFTRELKETDLHYLTFLSSHQPQRSMKRLTNTELANMHLIHGLSEGNARAAERLYRERYPQRDVPDRRMFTNLHPYFCEKESLRDNRHTEGGPRVTRSASMEQNELDTVRQISEYQRTSHRYCRCRISK